MPRAMQATLVDLFELRNDSEYTYAPRASRQSIDLEIVWEEGVLETSAQAAAPEHDWESTTTESSPGVSYESWKRARGWCAE